MILMRLLKKDVLKKKVVLTIVFIFIMLSSFLVATGAGLIVKLSGSLNHLFEQTRAPHFVQMHAGEIDRRAVERWAAENGQVDAVQTVEMITLDGSELTLDRSRGAEENSIMDISFVRQNEEFDFLLDLENRVISLDRGEIAVPIYYMEQREIGVGDTVTIEDGSFAMELTVAAFLRDAQMNPSIVHSKRFLVEETDYARLHEHFQESEYLIEFRLADPGKVKEFSDAYKASGLPKRGPSVDHRLFKTLNALTDGIVSAVLIVLSLLLMVIALLCLRFTILATMEEDYSEIGVMKAIGMNSRQIKRIYLSKHLVLAGLASLAGYLASLFTGRSFTQDMRLYLGSGSGSGLADLVPLAASAGIFLLVGLSCIFILRRIHGISAVEALRVGNSSSKIGSARLLPLSKSASLDVNVFLGMRDVVQRFRFFALLCFIFFFSSCIILLPVHFLSTINSPGFVSYMGIGRSDIRIDLRHSETVEKRYEELLDYVAGDEQVERYTPLVTSQFTLIAENGERETIAVESGDFGTFPIDYLHGEAPEEAGEIALSYLNSKDMEKDIGDHLTLLVDGRERRMEVSGIYQDVTDGGRTAKASLPYNRDAVLWYTLSMDLVPGGEVEEKQAEYAELFYPARVTDMKSYIAQTLGNTIAQLKMVTAVTVAVGVAVAVLITSLFLTMLLKKDAPQIAVMRSIGFSLADLRRRYLSTSATLLVLGVLAGTLFSNTVGSRLVGLVWGAMGAPQISFVIDPLRAYVLLPLLLLGSVAVTTLLSMGAVKNTTYLK